MCSSARVRHQSCHRRSSTPGTITDLSAAQYAAYVRRSNEAEQRRQRKQEAREEAQRRRQATASTSSDRGGDNLTAESQADWQQSLDRLKKRLSELLH
ncbi:hypothetical protein [Marinobacterium arenosum]|uniref:hypothetical protein n=1 Tax=Marinobacterium arenosum TaxID=2862496 RepID=UPI001C949A05|nr:hypothetical protein [Marinobacterium arenosum]MBY4679098.1 hypothetical protein [Marinobacterium arenosum]